MPKSRLFEEFFTVMRKQLNKGEFRNAMLTRSFVLRVFRNHYPGCDNHQDILGQVEKQLRHGVTSHTQFFWVELNEEIIEAHTAHDVEPFLESEALDLKAALKTKEYVQYNDAHLAATFSACAAYIG